MIIDCYINYDYDYYFVGLPIFTSSCYYVVFFKWWSYTMYHSLWLKVCIPSCREANVALLVWRRYWILIIDWPILWCNGIIPIHVVDCVDFVILTVMSFWQDCCNQQSTHCSTSSTKGILYVKCTPYVHDLCTTAIQQIKLYHTSMFLTNQIAPL